MHAAFLSSCAQHSFLPPLLLNVFQMAETTAQQLVADLAGFRARAALAQQHELALKAEIDRVDALNQRLDALVTIQRTQLRGAQRTMNGMRRQIDNLSAQAERLLLERATLMRQVESLQATLETMGQMQVVEPVPLRLGTPALPVWSGPARVLSPISPISSVHTDADLVAGAASMSDVDVDAAHTLADVVRQLNFDDVMTASDSARPLAPVAGPPGAEHAVFTPFLLLGPPTAVAAVHTREHSPFQVRV